MRRPHNGIIIAGVVAFLALVQVVCAWATYWYFVETTNHDLSEKTRSQYYWRAIDINNNSTAYPDNPKVKQIFTTTLSFLSLGGVALYGFVILLVAFICVTEKTRALKFTVIGFGAAAVVLLCVAFFLFLRITKAFNEDNDPYCLLGDNSPCKKFFGSYQSSAITVVWNGGPGFWVTLGAILFTIGATVSATKAILASE